jgi:hypothetical protein
MRVLLAVILCFSMVAPIHADEPSPGYASMKLLFCAYGSIGSQPVPPPPGFENQFAVAVVEVNSSRAVPNAPLPKVTLLYGRGKPIGTKRVISVEVFDEPFVPGEGNMAFYLNTNPRGHTHRWGGTLPAGMVHLRVRVALPAQAFVPIPKSCRVRIGPYVIEGPVDGSWPT